MSFGGYKEIIEEGDTVVLYMNNIMHAMDVQPEILNKNGVKVENVFQTTFGALKVKNLIGKKFGTKVSSVCLLPTRRVLRLCCGPPHRTGFPRFFAINRLIVYVVYIKRSIIDIYVVFVS
jgi:hypothetical protein